MCLAVPVRIVELGADGQAIAEIDGVRREISVALLDEVRAGDYVILHVGYAISRLDEQEAQRTLALFAQLGEQAARSAA